MNLRMQLFVSFFRLLASGSDDFQIIVWDVCRRMRKYKLDSGHQGNIFAVKVCLVNFCVAVRTYTFHNTS